MISMNLRLFLPVIVAVALIPAACDSGKETADTASGTAGLDSAAIAADSPANAEVRTYVVRGIPRKIDEAGGSVTIEHEEIKGFMDAMTMPFPVSDPALFKQMTVGQPIRFTLRVAGWEMQITKVEPDSGSGGSAGDSVGAVKK
jgi:protein SCO1/2